MFVKDFYNFLILKGGKFGNFITRSFHLESCFLFKVFTAVQFNIVIVFGIP